METRVVPTPLEDLWVIEIDYFRDERGFFVESYHQHVFAGAGIHDTFVQDNQSRSVARVLRGFHYQDLSAPMGKLVRCSQGAIFDVAIDLRAGSPTFGRWFGIELTDQNMKQLFVPVGFGHGFATLSEVADVQYKCSGFYAPAAEGTILWNDPDIGVEWPIRDPILSRRDQNGMSLRQYLENPAFHYRR